MMDERSCGPKDNSTDVLEIFFRKPRSSLHLSPSCSVPWRLTSVDCINQALQLGLPNGRNQPSKGGERRWGGYFPSSLPAG